MKKKKSAVSEKGFFVFFIKENKFSLKKFFFVFFKSYYSIFLILKNGK